MPPTDDRLRFVIDTTAAYVLRDGPDFEQVHHGFTEVDCCTHSHGRLHHGMVQTSLDTYHLMSFCGSANYFIVRLLCGVQVLMEQESSHLEPSFMFDRFVDFIYSPAPI